MLSIIMVTHIQLNAIYSILYSFKYMRSTGYCICTDIIANFNQNTNHRIKMHWNDNNGHWYKNITTRLYIQEHHCYFSIQCHNRLTNIEFHFHLLTRIDVITWITITAKEFFNYIATAMFSIQIKSLFLCGYISDRLNTTIQS